MRIWHVESLAHDGLPAWIMSRYAFILYGYDHRNPFFVCHGRSRSWHMIFSGSGSALSEKILIQGNGNKICRISCPVKRVSGWAEAEEEPLFSPKKL